MSKKMMNARLPDIKKISVLAVLAILVFSVFASCRQAFTEEETAVAVAENESPGLYLFDYENITVNTTSSIGTLVKNCNIYLDMYGDLIILGELENISGTIKTDMEITMDFLNAGSGIISSAFIPVKTDYLRKGAKYPFSYYFTEKEKYIELSSVKIGVNYRDHNDNFEGNPIARIEDYYYEGDYLKIKGRIINIGEEKIRDLVLLCTFYDSRDRVAFIKECYIPRERMMPEEIQDFTLEILLDDYLKDFSSFHFEVFFKDEIRVNV